MMLILNKKKKKQVQYPFKQKGTGTLNGTTKAQQK